jgi:ATP-dependent protease ClpP protease subunit
MSLFFDEDEEPIKLIPAPHLSHILNLSVDWKARQIYLDGEIEESTGSWLWTVLDQLGGEPVRIHLNTPGGDVVAMFAIHDAIRHHGAVTVLAYGQVCSAGVLILACAHDRAVTSSTILMSHESTSSQGELGYRAAKDRRKVDDWFHEYWFELMAKYTPQDEKWWKQTTERKAEYWLLGGKAIVAAGIADRVIE